MKRLRTIVVLMLFFCLPLFALTLTTGKELADVDMTDSVLAYYGYCDVNNDNWVIMRTSQTVENLIECKYAVGDGNYSIAWSSRTALAYRTVQDARKFAKIKL